MVLSVVLLLAVVAAASAAPQFPPQSPPIPILSSIGNRVDHGQYALSYQTGDVDEPVPNGQALVNHLSFSSTSPDGRPITVSYTVNENGFHPLPAAP